MAAAFSITAASPSEQEKSTGVKARVKAHAMRELMETKDRILIMGHKLSDSDAFGSAIGIYRIATALEKRRPMWSSTKLPHRFSR